MNVLTFSCRNVWWVISCTHRSYCVLGRQLAVDEQVGDLEEARLLRELLDRVAAVLEDALLAVDEGHRALARGGVDETGVVGRQARGVVVQADLTEVGGLDRAVVDRDLVVLAGPVVPDCQGVVVTGLGHVGSLALWWAAGAARGPGWWAGPCQPIPRRHAADTSWSGIQAHDACRFVRPIGRDSRSPGNLEGRVSCRVRTPTLWPARRLAAWSSGSCSGSVRQKAQQHHHREPGVRPDRTRTSSEANDVAHVHAQARRHPARVARHRRHRRPVRPSRRPGREPAARQAQADVRPARRHR